MTDRKSKGGPAGVNGGGADAKPPKVLGRESLRAPLPWRFYTTAVAAARDHGFTVELDGRPLKTPGKRALVVGSNELATAVAAEWDAQTERIDPARMPLTRIVNSAIDAVADQAADVAADIAAFSASDLVCYRAEGPAELVQRQSAAWDPVVRWARHALGVSPVITTGLMPVVQPPILRERVAGRVAAADPVRLAALHVMTSLTSSALLTLAHAAGALDAADAWAAAHVDENWQIEQWGEDTEASGRRALRHADFMAASFIVTATGKS
ncbi:MAG: ATP12 family chaperone protein [Hyphomicrobium sp.]